MTQNDSSLFLRCTAAQASFADVHGTYCLCDSACNRREAMLQNASGKTQFGQGKTKDTKDIYLKIFKNHVCVKRLCWAERTSGPEARACSIRRDSEDESLYIYIYILYIYYTPPLTNAWHGQICKALKCPLKAKKMVAKTDVNGFFATKLQAAMWSFLPFQRRLLLPSCSGANNLHDNKRCSVSRTCFAFLQ